MSEVLGEFVQNISKEDERNKYISDVLNKIAKMIDTENASDIYFQQGLKPIIRDKSGELNYIDELEILSFNDIQKILEFLLKAEGYNKKFSEVMSGAEIDMMVLIGDKRFRANITKLFSGERLGIYLRYIRDYIPNFTELGLPIDSLLRKLENISGGLILVCGPTGSGKSTTLASIVDYINQNYNKHIITLEDPIEYVLNSKKSIITQKQVGIDTKDFMHGLREALREDPDIIMLGEMRDPETIMTALQASETGHTVFATLHTSSTAQTIERLINAFAENKQQEIRVSLALALKVIIIQRLIPSVDKTRCLAYEIAFNTKTLESNILRNQINQIENTLYLGKQDGMVLLNHHLVSLIKKGTLTPQIAMAYAYNPDGLISDLKMIYGDVKL